jgi:diguanylate cyclase (GGDEF)-like protein
VRGPGTLVVPGVLILIWLVLSIPDGLTGFDMVAGLAAAALGAVVAVSSPAVGEMVGRQLGRLQDLLDLAEPAADGAAERVLAEGDGTALDEEDTAAVLESALEAVARDTAADRLVVWRLDPDGEHLRPEWSIGPAPPVTPAAGSPLRWALEERSALRLDPAPRWARGAAVVAPVDIRRVLTVESAPDSPPDPIRVGHAGSILGSILTFTDRETDALAARARLDRVVDFLAALPRYGDPGTVPDSLAKAALDLLGVRGSLVASWTGDHGIILAREGGVEGPAPGTEFRALDGDLAHVVRIESTLLRTPEDSGSAAPPLAGEAEHWGRPPLYRVVVPLVEPDGAVSGMVGGWGDESPSEQGITLVEAMAPLLALHLRQASDLVRFRARAVMDPLTGLPNRASLMDRLAEERARFHRYRRPVALLVLDLDHFKAINDRHGHEAGDEVLRRVAAILRAAVRDVDVPARFGGEELVVILPETMLHPAMETGERVRTAIQAAHIEHDGVAIPVTASVGVSACPECVDDPEALFRSADEALYEAKAGGRNRVNAAERTPSGA